MRKDDGLVGKKFGRLSVVTQIPTKEPLARGAPRYYRCSCSCGEAVEVRGYSLVSGVSQSCGCLQKEKVAARGRDQAGIARSHGAMIGVSSGTPSDPAKFRAHGIWRGMLRRCEDPRVPGYQRYGARGIKVCERWHTFENFLEDMGVPRSQDSIDRRDNDGDYCPENCHWAGVYEQANNKPGFNRVVEYQGESLSISQWAHKLNMNVHTLFNRLNRGWLADQALSKPVNRYSRRAA